MRKKTDPRRDVKTLDRLRRYLKHPRYQRDIVEHFDVAECTAYRWLRYLREEGAEIRTLREGNRTRFQIA